MHAFNAPVTSCPVGKAFDIEGQGGDVEAFIAGAMILVLGSVVALFGLDPVDGAGGCVDPGLDAAVALFDAGLACQLLLRGAVEVVLDLAFQGRLIALQGE